MGVETALAIHHCSLVKHPTDKAKRSYQSELLSNPWHMHGTLVRQRRCSGSNRECHTERMDIERVTS